MTPEIGPNHAWSGSRYIDVLDPRPEDIVPEEIATGLSREPRYGGACTRIFWSVAQHSILCEFLARKGGVTSTRTLRTILLHDAPEYMLRDLIRPVKRNCPEYVGIEARWWAAVAARFDLPGRLPPVVKEHDDLALAVEKRFLISERAGAWPGVPEPPERHVIPDWLARLGCDEIRAHFLSRLAILTGH